METNPVKFGVCGGRGAEADGPLNIERIPLKFGVWVMAGIWAGLTGRKGAAGTAATTSLGASGLLVTVETMVGGCWGADDGMEDRRETLGAD